MADEPDDKPEKDSLRDDLARAFESVTGEAVPPRDDSFNHDDGGDDDTPAPDAEAKAAAARDEAGRFAPKPKARETLTLKDKPPTLKDKAAAPADDPAKDGDAANGDAPAGDRPANQGPARVPPPVHWKGNEKLKWEKLSPYLQAAIKADYDANEKTYAPLKPVSAILNGSRELLETEGGSIEGGVQKLLQISTWARDNPIEFVQTFIRQRGLNPAQLFGQGQAPAQQGGQQYAQPQQVAPEIHSLQQRLDAFESAQKQRSLGAALTAIQSFANDPAHPYFADVQADMEQMLKAQPALGLQGAYDRAVWANPTTRAQMIAQQSAGASQDNQASVAAARRAKAANITGSPVPGAKSQPNGERPDDLRAELERNYRAAMGGNRV